MTLPRAIELTPGGEVLLAPADFPEGALEQQQALGVITGGRFHPLLVQRARLIAAGFQPLNLSRAHLRPQRPETGPDAANETWMLEVLAHHTPREAALPTWCALSGEAFYPETDNHVAISAARRQPEFNQLTLTLGQASPGGSSRRLSATLSGLLCVLEPYPRDLFGQYRIRDEQGRVIGLEELSQNRPWPEGAWLRLTPVQQPGRISEYLARSAFQLRWISSELPSPADPALGHLVQDITRAQAAQSGGAQRPPAHLTAHPTAQQGSAHD